MASIATTRRGPNAGHKRILFFPPNALRDASGRLLGRRTIHLGKIPKSAAREIKSKIEAIVGCLAAGTSWERDRQTAEWVAEISDDLAAKLAHVGLIPPRTPLPVEGKPESPPLGEFMAKYMDSRKNQVQHAGQVRPGAASAY